MNDTGEGITETVMNCLTYYCTREPRPHLKDLSIQEFHANSHPGYTDPWVKGKQAFRYALL